MVTYRGSSTKKSGQGYRSPRSPAVISPPSQECNAPEGGAWWSRCGHARRAPRPMKCVYVSLDGLLEPLGYSQVVRLVTRLAGRGFEYRILSLEKPEDLADEARRTQLRGELEAAGVSWDALGYDGRGTKRAAAGNALRMARSLARSARRADLIHARSYLPATIAAGLSPRGAPKLLFDTRGLWFDEKRVQAGPASARIFAGAKRLEHLLYRRADGVVTLTELSAEDVRAGRLGPRRAGRPVVAIPTAVDFDAFDLRHRPTARAQLRARWPGVGDGPVFGFVGSVNVWYRTHEALQLFSEIHRRRKDARLVVLSAQHKEIARKLEELRVPAEATLTTRAHHDEMSLWVAALDWGFLLLEASPAKRASMPTKLGEFLASGVRPIHYGCNSEVGDWVKSTGSGMSLPGLSPSDLSAAVEEILSNPTDSELLVRARQGARDHFSLGSAVERYAGLLGAL